MANDNLRDLAASASEVLERVGLDGLKAEVVLVVDVSRSMFPIYRARIVQDLVPQLLGLALNFDDDGVIPAYAFGDNARYLKDLRKEDFAGWVDREVIRTGSDYQQKCRYSPVIHEVCRYFFPEDWDRPALKETVGRLFKQERVVYPMLSAPRAYPVFCLFLTGGECEDEEDSADAIRRSSRLPIFFQFVGLQAQNKLSPFRFLKRLDKLGNTFVDNCGFYEPGDVRNPHVLYRGILNELPEYIKRKEVQSMLRPPELGGLETRGYRPEDEDEDAALDALTAMPVAEEEPEPEPELPPEPEPERDMSALRARFAGIEWSEGTHGGAGAVRAAAPVFQKQIEAEESSGQRRRMRPSEVRGEDPASVKDDSKARVAERLARLKAKFNDIDDAASEAPSSRPSARPTPSPPARSDVSPAARSPTPAPPARTPSPPSRPTPTPPARPSPPPARPEPPRAATPAPSSRPQPAGPRPQPAPSQQSAMDALRARLAAFGDDDATLGASGFEVDQEGVHAPPPPPSRPQPPPRKR